MTSNARFTPPAGTTFVNVPLTTEELSVVSAEAMVAGFGRRTDRRTPPVPVPPSVLDSLARASKEELEGQLAQLRLVRECSFGIRYGVGCDGPTLRAAEAEDRLVVLRMQAIRRELATR